MAGFALRNEEINSVYDEGDTERRGEVYQPKKSVTRSRVMVHFAVEVFYPDV